MATVVSFSSLLAFGAIVCALGSEDLLRNNASNATEFIVSPVALATSYAVVQTLKMTSLDDYLSMTALESACKGAVVAASEVPDSKVLVLIEKIKVKLKLCFSSPAASASTLREAIAWRAGVSIDAVDVKETTQRRLRRLTTSVIADIDASLDALQDGVQSATEIHKLVQNRSALQYIISKKSGMEIELSSVSSAVNVEMVSTITANVSIDLLRDGAFAERVGQAIGGNVTSHYVVNDAGRTSATSSVPIAMSTSSASDGSSIEVPAPSSLASRTAHLFTAFGVMAMTSWSAFA